MKRGANRRDGRITQANFRPLAPYYFQENRRIHESVLDHLSLANECLDCGLRFGDSLVHAAMHLQGSHYPHKLGS